MASFMEKYHVSRKEYMGMPCALIALMMLDAPKVLYGEMQDGKASQKEIDEISEINRNLVPQKMTMAEIKKQYNGG